MPLHIIFKLLIRLFTDWLLDPTIYYFVTTIFMRKRVTYSSPYIHEYNKPGYVILHVYQYMAYVIWPTYKTSTKYSISIIVKYDSQLILDYSYVCHAKTANLAKNMTLYMHDDIFKVSDKRHSCK